MRRRTSASDSTSLFRPTPRSCGPATSSRGETGRTPSGSTGTTGCSSPPHVDALFDAGLPSFTDDGDVLTAGPDVRAEMGRWGLDPDADVGPFNERQRGDLAHHRSEVYRPQG